jgi:tRNA threonylcarbamoyladenosine biosynthesis protein TsaB
MHILAIESVNPTASVALLEGNTLRCFKEGGNTLPQSEFLLPAIAEILKETSVSLQDINGIAVCTGTGSFTGIRIGLSAAYGLSLAANIPLVGVSAFAATAHQCAVRKLPLGVLLESQNTFYVQCFALTGEASTAPLLVTLEGLENTLPQEPFLKAGNGWAQWGEQPDFSTVVNAETIARAAAPLFSSNENPPFPLPLYVKESYAKRPEVSSLL